MRLPVIKEINSFIAERDEDYALEAIEMLESIVEIPSIKESELDVIGELLSNLYGAIEVNKMIQEGVPERDALNKFMQRVVGSIDKN